ncbi:MAG TPA: PAS domain S-box protein, partial [Thermoanaerobaculia bacterium]
DGRFVYVNAELMRILGATTADELIGKRAIDFVHARQKDAVAARQKELADGKSVPLIHEQLITLQGTLVDVEVAAAPVTYYGGPAAQVVVRDITDRVRAEKEIQALDERLRALAEGTGRAIWEWNLTTGDLWSNRGHHEIFGKVAGPQPRYDDWMERIHPADRARVRRRSELAVKTVSRRWSDEYRFRMPNGEYADILDRGSVIPGPDGTAHRMIGEMIDITAHRRAEEQLAITEQRYRDLVDKVRDVIFSIDVHGRITSLNPAFEHLTGYCADQWIGRPFAEVLAEESQDAARTDFEKLASRSARLITQYKLRTKTGAILDIEVSGQADIANGAVVGVVGIARDVTARNALERSLEESKRLSSLGHLAASMAHEFNNVLMSIRPFAESLARDSSARPQWTKAIRHIQGALARGKRVSEEILRFANPRPPETSPIAVEPWISEVLKEFEASKSDELFVHCDVESGVETVLADRGQLDQVLINLLINARDAMDGRGVIRIQVSLADARTSADLRLNPRKTYVHVSVTDSGAGMTEDVQKHVWEPFFTTKRTGTGLGLPIARKVIEAHGGTITFETAQGGGSTFHLFIPRADHAQAHDVAAAHSGCNVRRILLVEDEPSVAEGVRMMMQCVDVEVRHVSHGSEAVAALQEGGIDAAVVDLNLPDMDGHEVCARLRAARPDLPIVVATGHLETDEDVATGSITLMKPYGIDELLNAILRAQAHRR